MLGRNIWNKEVLRLTERVDNLEKEIAQLKELLLKKLEKEVDNKDEN